MSALLQNFLNTPVDSITPQDESQLSEEQFKELTAQIDEIRAKITSGQEASVEEARLIVVYFRARRGRLFTVKQEKAKKVKEKTERKAPAKRVTKKQIADMDALELLKDF